MLSFKFLIIKIIDFCERLTQNFVLVPRVDVFSLDHCAAGVV